MTGRTAISLLSAGFIALGGLSAGCASADNEPQTKRTVTEQVAPPDDNTPAATKETVSEANARAKAEDYLDNQAFSRKGLINQLEFEGFSTADATYGASAVGANWKEQAAKKAASYLDNQAFSRSGLVDQLKFEGFTDAEAKYGVSQTGL